jgi:glycerol kinase
MQMYHAALEAATTVMQRNKRLTVSSLGITNQRASVVAWDARSGEPVAAGIGWQDLRTVVECITAKSEHGLAIAPNQTATKAAWLLAHHAAETSVDDIRFGTIDTWLTWKLSGGTAFVTDHTNAAVTGLVDVQTVDWDPRVCGIFGLPVECLPRVVASREVVGHIAGHPGLDGIVLAARIGDQQSSLVGQGCIAPGRTKITFGTGGMLDMYTGRVGPTEAKRTTFGTFPIVAFSLAGNTRDIHWGTEAIMLSAGTNVEWLCTDMGLIASPEESDEVARAAGGTKGVAYVPALLGLGTPDWDYGARGTLTGLTRGTNRGHVVRAVLEGIAHRGADLLEAAVRDAASRGVGAPATLRVDGGMSRNATFVQLLADAIGKTVEVSPVSEATTLGAAYLAGTARDTEAVWPTLDAAVSTWVPATTVRPSTNDSTRSAARTDWARTLRSAKAWIPDLTALDF